MINSKGQSALEYLMTYGWALVVIIIVIAALFAFGIFNPPSAGTCSGLNKFLYKDHTVETDGTVTIALGNGSGSTINAISALYGGNDFTDVAGETVTVDGVVATSVTTGGDFLVVSAAAVGPTTGSYSGTITVTYTTASSGLPHTETATCTGSV